MSSIKVVVQQKNVTGITNQPAPWRKTRMTIRAIGYKTMVRVPFAPSSIEYSGFGHNWAEVERPGRKPLLVRTTGKLRKVSFDMYVGPKTGNQSDMSYLLKQLQNFSSSGAHIMLYYNANFENVLWRFTNYTFTSITRDPDTNGIIEASAHLEFTEIQNYVASTGPVTGGVKKPSSGTPAKSNTGKQIGKEIRPGPTAKTYTVKKGDTLSGIAIKVYRDANKWIAIAKLNKITKPSSLKVGQVLKLP